MNATMRRHFLDNIRWVTVLLVLFYHVIYFYNAKGVFGGIGGFHENQPQDAVMSLLYPWFMMLLFLVAGISSRYALNGLSHREFLKCRTRKLLVPATIGLFVFQWMVGYFNTRVAAVAQGIAPFADIPEAVPHGVQNLIKYFAYLLSGIGPLWFIQDLWIFSLIQVLILRVEKDRLLKGVAAFFGKRRAWVAKLAIVVVGFLLIWAGAQASIDHPEPGTMQGLWNLYRPLAYLMPYLLGYFVFSIDAVQDRVEEMRFPMLVSSLATGAVFATVMYGKDDTAPMVLQGWLCNLFAWLAILAILGCFRAWANRTNRFASYMAKASFGIYVVHYLVIASLGYMMKVYTIFQPWAMYVVLFCAVMLLSPVLYELLRRIPLVGWCVLGVKSPQKNSLMQAASPMQ